METNSIRDSLQYKEECKISFQEINRDASNLLWQICLLIGENVKALLAADDGRAQALRDVMEMKYGIEQTLGEPSSQEKSVRLPLVDLPSNVVFSAINEGTIFFWVIQNGKDVSLRMKSVNTFIERDEVALFIQVLLKEL